MGKVRIEVEDEAEVTRKATLKESEAGTRHPITRPTAELRLVRSGFHQWAEWWQPVWRNRATTRLGRYKVGCARRIHYEASNSTDLSQFWSHWGIRSTLTIRPRRLKRQTYLTVLMGQVHHMLWQTGRLHNASHFQGTLLLYQLAYRVEQFRGEL
jgi:hypothetical protein